MIAGRMHDRQGGFTVSFAVDGRALPGTGALQISSAGALSRHDPAAAKPGAPPTGSTSVATSKAVSRA
ncbi:hypothetical protein C4N9_00690 [Pararhodobacter marinus]|uniref:Uncharacterized protein n=1 Tax=Pararhodobacter marinus TaxID=2184063 RepID=A0A2U2CI64_9RHOB|nr:hypothetical protein C4N9_00690 [Pararhodobacter marinus]